MDKHLVLGTLISDGRLRTESGDILMSILPSTAPEKPESAKLDIAQENIGKTAIVKGTLSQKILYSSEVIEISSKTTSALIRGLIDKGIISLDEIEKQVKDIASEAVKEEPGRLCALVIGHKKGTPGAVNTKKNLSEYVFNEDLALRIEKKVKRTELQRIYRRIYKELPNDINALNPDFSISLHCNAFNTQATGTEVLYYYSSEKGKVMAEILQNHLVEHLKLPDRGIKPKAAEDRGGYLLRYTKAPCVIAESFFIDNDSDLARAEEDKNGLAKAYATAIEEIAQEI